MKASIQVGKVVDRPIVRQANWPVDRLLGRQAGWEAGKLQTTGLQIK